MVRAAVDSFVRLDVAVNNAGISGPQLPTGEYPLDGWAAVIAVNLSGVFYSMRAAMLADGGGSIVNMASILGSVGFAQSVAYVSAKHGVGMTKSAALEYVRQGIRVNSVGPGFIETPLLAAVSQEIIAGVGQLHPLGGWVGQKRWPSWWHSSLRTGRRTPPARTSSATACSGTGGPCRGRRSRWPYGVAVNR